MVFEGRGNFPDRDENTQATLFVRNVTNRVSEKHLIKIFSKYGNLKRVHVPVFKDGPKEGQPRSFCFIEYETPQVAREAMAALNDRILAGRRLDIRVSGDDAKAAVEPVGEVGGPVFAGDDKADTKAPATPIAQQIIAIEAKLRLMEEEPTLTRADTLHS